MIIAFVDNTFSIKIYNITAIVCLLSLILRGRQENYNIKKPYSSPFYIFNRRA